MTCGFRVYKSKGTGRLLGRYRHDTHAGVAADAHLVLCHIPYQRTAAFFARLAYRRANFRRECLQRLWC